MDSLHHQLQKARREIGERNLKITLHRYLQLRMAIDALTRPKVDYPNGRPSAIVGESSQPRLRNGLLTFLKNNSAPPAQSSQ